MIDTCIFAQSKLTNFIIRQKRRLRVNQQILGQNLPTLFSRILLCTTENQTFQAKILTNFIIFPQKEPDKQTKLQVEEAVTQVLNLEVPNA